jgi:hypothetical protein
VAPRERDDGPSSDPEPPEVEEAANRVSHEEVVERGAESGHVLRTPTENKTGDLQTKGGDEDHYPGED